MSSDRDLGDGERGGDAGNIHVAHSFGHAVANTTMPPDSDANTARAADGDADMNLAGARHSAEVFVRHGARCSGLEAAQYDLTDAVLAYAAVVALIAGLVVALWH